MLKQKEIFKLTLGFWVIALIFAISPVSAAVSQEGWDPDAIAGSISGQGLPDPQGGVFTILLTFINWALIIIGLLCLIAFIYSGFLYLTGQGENDKIEQAKKVVTYAVVGTVVAVLGLVAVRTIDMIMRGNAGVGAGAAGTGTNLANPGGNPAMTSPGAQTGAGQAAGVGNNPATVTGVGNGQATGTTNNAVPAVGSGKAPTVSAGTNQAAGGTGTNTNNGPAIYLPSAQSGSTQTGSGFRPTTDSQNTLPVAPGMMRQ